MKFKGSLLFTMFLIVALSLGAAAGLADDDKTDAAKPKALTLDVYALDTCPVSGQKLGSMGDPIVKMIDDREVRFCCAGCVEPFEKEKEEHFKKIDATLIEQQKKHYPLDECVVSGVSLEEAEAVVDHIHEGRLVRFGCPDCPARFNADPDRFLVKLDEAIIEQQREHYPLENCVVADMKLGSMGEPHEVIVGSALVRFCCAGCVSGFKRDPAKHLATIHEAWKKQHEKEHSEKH